MFVKDLASIDDIFALTAEHFPHIVRLKYNENPNFLRRGEVVWCVEQFGEGSEVVRRENSLTMLRIDTEHPWLRYRGLFGFKDADKAFAFKMRWG
ncbi:MAG: hypothetical protein EOP83_14765 [Verrucomicrobiaceae bacterium]|nr:MAG: hypothetical protein EOP83_14765 [Verrucomicrobiaceae bacterium]